MSVFMICVLLLLLGYLVLALKKVYKKPVAEQKYRLIFTNLRIKSVPSLS